MLRVTGKEKDPCPPGACSLAKETNVKQNYKMNYKTREYKTLLEHLTGCVWSGTGGRSGTPSQGVILPPLAEG